MKLFAPSICLLAFWLSASALADGLSNLDLTAIAQRTERYNRLVKRKTFRTVDADREVAKSGWKIAGVRAMKPVLAGSLYRAGGPGGMTDLEDATLRRLCRAGFSNAIYLYAGYFHGEKDIVCETPDGSLNQFHYQSLEFRVGRRKIMQVIYRNIMDAYRGPVLVHCWNGLHATGEISAIALKQFCSYTNDEAIDNFMKNTRPGVDLEALKKQIRNYKVEEKLVPPPEVQKIICPQF